MSPLDPQLLISHTYKTWLFLLGHCCLEYDLKTKTGTRLYEERRRIGSTNTFRVYPGVVVSGLNATWKSPNLSGLLYPPPDDLMAFGSQATFHRGGARCQKTSSALFKLFVP